MNPERRQKFKEQVRGSKTTLSTSSERTRCQLKQKKNWKENKTCVLRNKSIRKNGQSHERTKKKLYDANAKEIIAMKSSKKSTVNDLDDHPASIFVDNFEDVYDLVMLTARAQDKNFSCRRVEWLQRV